MTRDTLDAIAYLAVWANIPPENLSEIENLRSGIEYQDAVARLTAKHTIIPHPGHKNQPREGESEEERARREISAWLSDYR